MMPAYKADAYIGPAIESLRAQEFSNWELVIVFDGPGGRMAEIASAFQDPRIRLFEQSRAGEAAARNLALDRSRGEFVAFLDADDQFLPDHLRRAVAHLQTNPRIGGVYTDGFHVDEEGRRGPPLSSRRRGPFEGRIFEQLVRASDVFGPPICVVLRRDRILPRRLQFDPRIVIGPDWDFLTRFAETEEFGHLPEKTCLYRVHGGNITHSATPQNRLASLALCREKAVKLSGFALCPPDVRTYVFYDLLVNLTTGQTERQEAITLWPEFKRLPVAAQARLFRLMAGRAIALGDEAPAGPWFRRAVQLHPSSLANRALLGLFNLSPSLCRTALKARAFLPA
jgi:glycosyltransferase involved in cell wall biosynthesis